MQDKLMYIRLAIIADALDILNWRNDELSRRMSFNSDEVSFSEHYDWFNNLLESSTSELFIGTQNDEKIGVCRFDIVEEKQLAEVSINLNPTKRGKHLSKSFLKLSMEELFKNHNVSVKARIKKENLASIKLFEGLGFKQTSATDTEYQYLFLKPDGNSNM